MRVYFTGGYDGRRPIAAVDNMDAARAAINTFINEHHYKSYYQRWWAIDTNMLKVDVGSWTQFFEIEDVPDDIMKTYN